MHSFDATIEVGSDKTELSNEWEKFSETKAVKEIREKLKERDGKNSRIDEMFHACAQYIESDTESVIELTEQDSINRPQFVTFQYLIETFTISLKKPTCSIIVGANICNPLVTKHEYKVSLADFTSEISSCEDKEIPSLCCNLRIESVNEFINKDGNQFVSLCTTKNYDDAKKNKEKRTLIDELPETVSIFGFNLDDNISSHSGALYRIPKDKSGSQYMFVSFNTKQMQYADQTPKICNSVKFGKFNAESKLENLGKIMTDKKDIRRFTHIKQVFIEPIVDNPEMSPSNEYAL